MTAVRGFGGVVVLLLTLGGTSGAHWVSPATIVAQLNGPSGHAQGIERAVRDEKAPRLLVVRVGERWYAVPPAKRREEAAAWLELWRHNVAQGIVAVLDAQTEQPVVRFGPGGRVLDVTPGPHERGKASP